MGDVLAGTKPEKVVYAKAGAGPLLQRDYLGVIEGVGCTPEDLANQLRERFVDFAPQETADFQHPDGKRTPLAAGDQLKILIGGLLPCQVRVVHIDRRSL